MNERFTITFAGQAGFIIQMRSGYSIGIDLYLSDCCQRYFGFKRLMPFLYNPVELGLDLLVATHAHYDHFDPDAVPLIMSNFKTRLVAAPDVAAEAQRLNLDSSRITYLKTNDVFENEYVNIKAMPCDHGEEAPHAIGLIISAEERKIYITGDTAYREDFFVNSELSDLDVMIMPINGVFGNMNEIEGAKAVNIIKPKLSIPCHFWNFAEHGGDPARFVKEMKEVYGNTNYILMRPGERIEI